MGRSVFDAYEFAPQLRALGFCHITQRQIDVPVNGWRTDDPKMKGIGVMNLRNALFALTPLSYAILGGVLHWPPQAVAEFIGTVTKDLENEALQVYLSM